MDSLTSAETSVRISDALKNSSWMGLRSSLFGSDLKKDQLLDKFHSLDALRIDNVQQDPDIYLNKKTLLFLAKSPCMHNTWGSRVAMKIGKC